MSSPVITRITESLAQLCYIGDKKKIKAIFTLYRVAYPYRHEKLCSMV